MKILVTGASGYVARVTLPYLFGDPDVAEVHGIDVRPPGIEHPKFHYIEGDVRRARMEALFQGMDAVVHMAFIVSEIRDKKAIHDINVNGTRRVLDAVRAACVRRLVVASSICAYGSHPGRAPLTEDAPLAGNPDSYYAHTKRAVEQMLDAFEQQNPGVTVTRVRPSILCGPGTDNFFVDLLSPPVIFYPASNPQGLPLVHEDDAGQAFHLAIKKGAAGAFNIAAGNLSYAKMKRLIHKPAVGVPFFLLKPLSDIGFFLGAAPVSSHWVVLSRYPFHLSCEKAKDVLGWAPRRTPEQAFREMVASWKTQ